MLCLVLPLVGAAKCNEDTGDPRQPEYNKEHAATPPPGCPDIEFRDPSERCFTIQTFVESRLGPYDVYIEIRGGAGAYPPHVPIASGGWKHAVVYRTGAELSIKVTLRYEGAESKDGFCSITDGSELYKKPLKSIRAKGGSPYEAVCALTTSQ